MAVAAHHALFNVPRIGPDLEHIQIVIRLEDETLTAFHSLLNHFMNITQVGDHSDFNAIRFQRERHGVRRVVGNGKRRDFDVADDELFARGEEQKKRKAWGPTKSPRAWRG